MIETWDPMKWWRPARQPSADSEPRPYPYPQLLRLLQVLCTPAEYARVEEGADNRGRPDDFPNYGQIIPEYTYAECPICRTRYREPIDTYSLRRWDDSPWALSSRRLARTGFPAVPICPHFVGVQYFINLHGVIPTEMKLLTCRYGEAPYLTPEFMPANIPGYAVLHALPICRTENEEFVPRYTQFRLTYFSRDPGALRTQILVRLKEQPVDDQWPDPFTPLEPSPTRYYDRPGGPYNLKSWAAAGQLGWLELTQPELPLRIGPGLALPNIYQNIQGRHKAYTWRAGKFTKGTY